MERVSLQEVWGGLENCRAQGLCRSIGVINCPVIMLMELLTFCIDKPEINALEVTPYFNQDDIIAFNRKLGVEIGAYCPLKPYHSPES